MAEFSLNQIDLNLLRTFDVLMRERSVTRAADRLGRTQSAISHSLGRLRDVFKDDLFTREAGIMEPTARAKELAEVISQALHEIRVAVDRHLNFDPTTTSRNFRIGLSDYTAVTYLPELIENFSMLAPNASLNVVHAREPDALGSLKNREVECAVLGNPKLDAEHFEVVELSRDRMVCAGWTGNPAMADMSLDRYLASPHLQISADGIAAGVTDITLQKLGLHRKVVATIPHYLVAPWVIKGTELISAFGDGVLLALSEESETAIVPPPLELPDVTISLIFDRSNELDPGHVWFRNLIKDVSDRQRTLKQGVYERLEL
ncbi:LysR family transcriptional regulator [Rhizobium leguminosarum]|uniref:LysR family transcriptional regulator n=1 Tax=Rhizobium leguminosarum TaxID=384 RepID=UPI001C96F525|nr:LysR family transcriptional regulator [Rhizobium leguminosarum]MBY5903894.1 LysR family transcriptional regulator [Rhizobium leguminosarum]MBY5911009.1 LysR family transcriptional regulator [Rhizobium leguminosarum]